MQHAGGSTPRTFKMRPNTEADFWAKVDFSGECWIWTGAKDSDGYGIFRLAGKQWRAGRLSLAFTNGELPPELMASPTCRNPSCVRPQHLAGITVKECTLRGNSIQGQNARKTHCKRGHALAGENLSVDRRGCRSCKECGRRISRDWMRAASRTKKLAQTASATSLIWDVS